MSPKKTKSDRPTYRRKCAFPFCSRNTYPPTKGFCKEHWEQWKAGDILDAAAYLDEEYFESTFSIRKESNK